MAKNTGRGRRTGSLAQTSAAINATTRMWTRRNDDPDRFHSVRIVWPDSSDWPGPDEVTVTREAKPPPRRRGWRRMIPRGRR